MRPRVERHCVKLAAAEVADEGVDNSARGGRAPYRFCAAPAFIFPNLYFSFARSVLQFAA